MRQTTCKQFLHHSDKSCATHKNSHLTARFPSEIDSSGVASLDSDTGTLGESFPCGNEAPQQHPSSEGQSSTSMLLIICQLYLAPRSLKPRKRLRGARCKSSRPAKLHNLRCWCRAQREWERNNHAIFRRSPSTGGQPSMFQWPTCRSHLGH